MFRFASYVRRRRLSLAFGTSALAWGLTFPATALAQCLPDPTTANGTTICSGTDADGIRVTSPGTTLTVASGAAVSSTGTSAIAVDAPVDIYGYRSGTINVLGDVSAPGQNAIAIWSGTLSASTYYSSQQIALTIGTEGRVSGATALALLPSPGNSNGTITATVDNAGTLTGTSGIALLGDAAVSYGSYISPLASFSTITNRASGQIIGGIVGSVSTLTNEGLIDGGSGSAINSSGLPSSPTITNEVGGIIRSSSSSATILADPNAYLTVINAGTIANSGSGDALAGGTLRLTNEAGGEINGDIIAAAALNLVNRGVITGNIVASQGGSVIDSTAGTINGSLTLGPGTDTLITRYVGSRSLATGVTGTINAGSGINTEQVVFASDTSVTTPIDLDAGFQQLVLAPDTGVTATLETGFATSTGLVLSGKGAVVNRATINLAGTALSDLDYSYGSSASFLNEGSITATLSGSPFQGGVTLNNHSFTNDGQVAVSGGIGVRMSYNPFINNGTVIASGTGVDMSDAVLTNNGTIISTSGTGINLFGSVGYTAFNNGTIQGATAGATTYIYLTNSGTISGGETGVAVQAYGYLINTADGVVNSGTNGAVTVNSFNSGVANAGTINGDVVFGGVSTGADSRNYFALAGGTLNGNLSLAGATLITDLVNTGPGQFAGINGTVSADTSSALRYAVSTNASAVLPAGNIGPFSNVGYQLSNDASLTLTASGTQARTQPLMLAGKGSIDLDANIAVVGGAAIRSASSLVYPGLSQPTDALSIISRGTLAITRTNNNSYYSSAAVVLSSADTFENVGDISVTDHLGYATAGITGGASVINSGRITLDGGVGISGATSGVNSGTIMQLAGGVVAKGVTLGSGSIENSGTINVGGSAVELGGFYSSNAVSLVNSGTLISTGGAAVTTSETSYGRASVSNLTGGTISGSGGTAVRGSNISLTNAGTITGTVDLGYAAPTYTGAPTRSWYSSTYVAAGGMVTGDLLFGRGDDLLMQVGESLGVSGVIDGGEGTDIFGRSLASSGTVALNLPGVINFEDLLLQAVGNETVLTTTGALSGNLYAAGTGSLLNDADIIGNISTSLPYSVTNPYTDNPLFPRDQILSSLTNAGSVQGAVTATTPVFVNSGSITTTYGPAVSLDSATSLSFTNSGAITGTSSPFSPFPYYYNAWSAVSLSSSSDATITNSGQIDGGLSARIWGAEGQTLSLAFSNSGTIANGGALPSVSLDAGDYYYGQNSGGTIQAANSGTISAEADATNGNRAIGLSLYTSGGAQPYSYVVGNSGTIAATAASSAGFSPGVAVGLFVGTAYSGTPLSGTVTNSVGARISAQGDYATAISVGGTVLDLSNAGTISATGTKASYAILATDALDSRIVNTGTITGDIMLNTGADDVRNAGTINGNVTLGEGDDHFTQGLGATLNGMVDGGAGTDALVIDISGGGLLDQALLDKFVDFESQSITGTGTITTGGPLAIDSLILRDANLTLAEGETLTTASDTSIIFAEGTNSLTNLGTISGGLSFTGGTNSVVNRGSIAGPVLLGSGSNSFTISAGSSVSGPVIAAGSDDLLILATGGTDDSPQELRLASFAGFERTRPDSGTLALSGEYTTGQLTVAGGRFIGRTGSVLNAASILVNHGATFGSAGTVNGDIAVQGTLSPGSSPGTMTVNGNVALAGSSTTLFEMTPTISDALIINGTLSIAPGATLKIVGNRPLTPGVTYELITTTSGIVGSFTTIDQASSVVGLVRQGDRSIDLLGQFVLGSAASGQITQTVDYLNDLLIAGTATSGILNAASSLLLADGTVNQAAVARLNAESYASAAQIGIENGLAIASALRTTSTSAQGEEAGLFTFGQALGGWRRLPGDAALGTSRANISTYGALAGIGFGSQAASLGAFIGYIDARQQIGALAAETKADGILAGAVAQGALGGIHVTASLSFDGSKADTDRSLLNGSKLGSHYRLRSWTADINLGHAFDLADGWTIAPEVGFTHIASRRSGASETGDAVWALDVDGRRTRASFLRGTLELRGSAEARISPSLSVGALHQLSGTRTFATAAYASVPDSLSVAGAGRSETLATVGAGASLRLSATGALYAGANSEFGAQSSGQSVTVGYRMRF
jgi:hypothetical protein